MTKLIAVAEYDKPTPLTLHQHRHLLTGELAPVRSVSVAFENANVKGWNKYRRGNIKHVTLTYDDGCKQLITYEKEAKFNGHYK
jgi:hypothetical protein